MAPKCSFSTNAPSAARADVLVVPVFSGRRGGPGAADVDRAIGGLAAVLAGNDLSGAPGEVVTVPAQGIGAPSVMLVGLGDPDAVDAQALRRAGVLVGRRAAHVASVAATVVEARAPGLARAEAVQAFAEGIATGAYRFLRYKGDAKPPKLARVVLLGSADAEAREAARRAALVSDAVAWARDLVNEPAGAKSPEEVARLARALARRSGLTVRVLAGEQLVRSRLGGIIGVGQGSIRPPRLVRLAYEPAGAKRTLALVGKGVVFDSGGLSIKPASGMETMKTDMSGAASVIAAMSVLRDLKVKTRVIGFVPLVENMPSGTAIRPGDVLRIRNGKTVEVLNTDAEGRLILADALSLAVEEKPDAIVDVATLTGACVVALGERVAGLMGSNEAWISQVREVADRVGEAVWPLPLPEMYRKMIDSDIADLKNIGGSSAGTLTAGLFLREFVGDRPWVHLDIAGPSRASGDNQDGGKGGTGFGVRTLVELARTFQTPRG